MPLAVDLMSAGMAAEPARVLGLSTFNLQPASTQLGPESNNVYLTTEVGAASVTFSPNTPIGKPFWVSNSTAETALLRPHPYQVSKINGQDQVSVAQFQTRIVIRLDTNRWISFLTA